ncbi:MAG: hypothetical protein EA376_04740 [Phycisphaeraceae bacterium]|nr:MAG: hypothetical protein EA376_04740 [Phycisphaeraceae bacterium]
MLGKALILSCILSPVLVLAFIVYMYANFNTIPLFTRDETSGRIPLREDATILFMCSYMFFPLTFPLVAWVRPFKIRRERQPPHLCRYCRYDMSGVESGACPECGKRHDLAANEARNWLTRRAFRLWRIPIIAYAILGYGFAIVWHVTFEPTVLNYRTPFEQGLELFTLALLPAVLVWAYWMLEGAMIRSDELGD